MTLLAGDLTTPARLAAWIPELKITPDNLTLVRGLISSTTNTVYSKLSRARVFSQQFTRSWNGPGTNAIVLPDYPVTAISQVQMGAALILPLPLPVPNLAGAVVPPNNFGYGWRVDFWPGNLPGEAAVLQMVGGFWLRGVDNVKITYTAGYLISAEAWTIPSNAQLIVLQPQGLWSHDGGVVFTPSGVSLTPVLTGPTTGQYTAPTDDNPGLYTFATADVGRTVAISYAFIPAELELACQILTGELYSYRTRIGLESKSLGGQETMRYKRGGNRGQMFPDLPPEVSTMIEPYVSTVPPVLGPQL